jgi:hypothetical protein
MSTSEGLSTGRSGDSRSHHRPLIVDGNVAYHLTHHWPLVVDANVAYQLTHKPENPGINPGKGASTRI